MNFRLYLIYFIDILLLLLALLHGWWYGYGYYHYSQPFEWMYDSSLYIFIILFPISFLNAISKWRDSRFLSSCTYGSLSSAVIYLIDWQWPFISSNHYYIYLGTGLIVYFISYYNSWETFGSTGVLLTFWIILSLHFYLYEENTTAKLVSTLGLEGIQFVTLHSWSFFISGIASHLFISKQIEEIRPKFTISHY